MHHICGLVLLNKYSPVPFFHTTISYTPNFTGAVNPMNQKIGQFVDASYMVPEVLR